MSRFLILIYGDESQWADAPPEWHADNGRRHRTFLDGAGGAVLIGGELAPSAQATSIRGDDPAGAPSPGPFVRADKGIGGFYVIEADSLDQAIERARAIPETSNPHSGLEIRPIA